VRVFFSWLLYALLGPLVVVLIVFDVGELIGLAEGRKTRTSAGSKIICALSGIALAVAVLARTVLPATLGVWFWIAAPLGLVLMLVGFVALHAELKQ